MNNRQLEAARHKRELDRAKRELIDKVNEQVQSAKGRGYQTRVAPQLLRLLGVKSYRKREVQSMNRLVNDYDKLSEYIAVVDPSTGELISGGEALERYSRYEQSPIYHRVEPEELPSEAERTVNNFVDTIDDVIHDDGTYKAFEEIIMKAIEQDTSIADFERWCIEHPSMADPRKSQKDILRSMVYWLYINRDNSMEMQNATLALQSAEGEAEVARRIIASGETVLDAAITAAIGYQENSGRAIQTVLKVLLPKATRERAMAMQEVVDVSDDFGDYD